MEIALSNGIRTILFIIGTLITTYGLFRLILENGFIKGASSNAELLCKDFCSFIFKDDNH